MKKNNNILITLLLSAFFVYSLVIFFCVEEMNLFFWYSFALTLIIVLFQIILNEYLIIKDITLTDVLFNLPILAVGVFFISVQIIYAIIFSVFNNSDKVILFIIQFFTFSLFGTIMTASILNMIKNRKIIIQNNNYPTKLAESLKLIEANIEDLNSKVLIRQLYEIAKNSNPYSPKEASDIEIKIHNKIVNLDKIMSTGDSITLKKEVRELSRLFEERNRLCNIF